MARPLDGPAGAPGPSSSELWTLPEGVQGVSRCHSFVPLAKRPVSFSVRNSREGNGNRNSKDNGNDRNGRHPSKNYHNHHSKPAAGTGSDDDSARFGFGRDGPTGFRAKMRSSDDSWAECEDSAGAAAAAVNGEGFPVLRRRRTFTEPSRSKSRCSVFVDDGAVSGGPNGCFAATAGSGRVPMSTSEDNMLSLLRKRSNLSRSVPVQPEQPEQPAQEVLQSCHAAVDEPRRNMSVLRLHRAGLVEDLAKCVMDVVRGTPAAAAATGEKDVGPSPAVTLEEVKKHLRSLPEKYSLSVEPEDVLTHMTLFDEVAVATEKPTVSSIPFSDASTSAASSVDIRKGPAFEVPPTVRVSVSPSRSPSTTATAAVEPCRPRTAAEVTPSEGVGSGGSNDCHGTSGSGGGGGDGDIRSRRCTVTVVCSRSPLPLEAVSSALLSAAVVCLDADVMSTKMTITTRCPGLSLGRFEVGVAVSPKGSLRSAAGVEAAGEADALPSPPEAAEGRVAPSGSAPASRVSGSMPLQRQPQEVDDSLHLLASFLSSTIAASMGEGERQEQEREGRESTIARCGIVSEGSSSSLARCGTGEMCLRVQPWMPSVEATVVATSARKASAGAGGDQARSSLPTVEARGVEVPRHPARGKTKRERLVRRHGEFFSAEASADTTWSVDHNGVLLSGGGGGGGQSVSGHTDPIGWSGGISLHDAPAGVAGSGNLVGGNSNDKDSRLAPSSNDNAGNDGESHPAILPAEIELLVLVGKGRFTRTYKARWRGLTVAVKTLELPPPGAVGSLEDGAATGGDGRSVAVAEFERELHVVRRLRHPNVCGFRGVCVAPPDRLFLVYDFLANGTLGARLRDTGSDGTSAGGHGTVGGSVGRSEGGSTQRVRPKGALSPGNLVAIVKGVVEGMIYLHELGVLHRDLKPDNILLDAADRAVVADFGLAVFCSPVNEHTAETGTYRWMAPEVIRHEPYSRPADVYSFGMVLWQVLTRRQPFEGLTPIQAAFSVASQGLRPPLPQNSPPALLTLISRCWHPTPGTRPSFLQIRAELPEIERQMLTG